MTITSGICWRKWKRGFSIFLILYHPMYKVCYVRWLKLIQRSDIRWVDGMDGLTFAFHHYFLKSWKWLLPFQLADVFRHPWVAGTTKNEPELELPMSQVVQVLQNIYWPFPITFYPSTLSQHSLISSCVRSLVWNARAGYYAEHVSCKYFSCRHILFRARRASIRTCFDIWIA